MKLKNIWNHLLEINISHTSRHFWVDDFPNFPRWDMLISRGTGIRIQPVHSQALAW